jgi:hypothetical protein
MPLPPIPVPQYPNVPFVPGVPPVSRSPGFPPTAIPALLFADSLVVDRSAQPARWGIFSAAGQRVVQADSAYAFSFVQEFRISDYPVEQGGFESYNKVATPYDTRVVLTKGGTEASRQNFLNQLQAVVASLDLYDVVTPEKTYISANVVKYDYDRASHGGVSLLVATVSLREVRQNATTLRAQSVGSPVPLTNTKSPSGADPTTVGTVQPQGLTTPQLSAIEQAWGGTLPGSW